MTAGHTIQNTKWPAVRFFYLNIENYQLKLVRNFIYARYTILVKLELVMQRIMTDLTINYQV